MKQKVCKLSAANKDDLLRKTAETILDIDAVYSWSSGVDLLIHYTDWKDSEKILNTLKYVESIIEKKKLNSIFYAQEAAKCLNNCFKYNKGSLNVDAMQRVATEICDPKQKYSAPMHIMGLELLVYAGDNSAEVVGEKRVWIAPLRQLLKQYR
jgi:hypothetical protein